MHCAKNTQAERFDFFQLAGPQDSGQNLGAFLSGTQGLEALPATEQLFLMSSLPFNREAAPQVGRSLRSHLSALQVPPHGPLATDGEASVVQDAQEKQRQAEDQASGDA